MKLDKDAVDVRSKSGKISYICPNCLSLVRFDMDGATLLIDGIPVPVIMSSAECHNCGELLAFELPDGGSWGVINPTDDPA